MGMSSYSAEAKAKLDRFRDEASDVLTGIDRAIDEVLAVAEETGAENLKKSATELQEGAKVNKANFESMFAAVQKYADDNATVSDTLNG